MKKFAIVVCVVLSVMISSCRRESKFPQEPSKFVVTEIQNNKTKGTNLYFVEPIEKYDLNISRTWFVDSVGKFNAGDTLSFQRLSVVVN